MKKKLANNTPPVTITESKCGIEEKNRMINEFTRIITRLALLNAKKNDASNVDDGDYKCLRYNVANKRDLKLVIFSKIGIGIGGVLITIGVGLISLGGVWDWKTIIFVLVGIVLMVIGFCVGYPK